MRRLWLKACEIDVARQGVDLLRQRVLLGLMVVFAITTVVCAAAGLHWPVPATTGGGGITTWIASAIEGRRTSENFQEP